MKHNYRCGSFAALAFHRLIICLGSICMVAVLQAAEPGAGELSLREAMVATLQANPALGIYRFRDDALRGEHMTAALLPPLQVNTGIEDVLGSGSLNGMDGSEFTLTLSRVIELGDLRTARVDTVGQRQALLQAEQRITELDLLAEVTRRFIATAAAQEILVLQERASSLAQQTLEALQPLVTAGQTPVVEQVRATAAQTRARLAQAQARANLETARINLASMWASQTPVYERVQANLPEVGDAGNLSSLLLALQASPDIALYASEERLQDAKVREANSARRGSLQWTAGIRHLRETGDSGLVFGVSMPLGNKARAGGAIATAKANLQEVASRRAIALNQMRSQLIALHVQLQHAILEVNTLRDDVLPQLSTAQEQTRAAYLSGRYSYLELISAQSEYLDAELALITAATDAHLLRTEIERLSGSALDSQEITP